MAALPITWRPAFRIGLCLLLFAAFAAACTYLPVETTLEGFLLWMKEDLDPWGPLVLAIAYIPLAVLAFPTSVLTLGGGYLFGLPVGFIADSIGATMGATVAFSFGRTIGRSYMLSILKGYPKFQAVSVATERSGFKIVLLLRLVPLLPFSMLNYLLSLTPIHVWEYMAATWLGITPSTFALAYVGTTLKDVSDIHGWNEISTANWVFIALVFTVSIILIICITKVAQASLENALIDNAKMKSIMSPSMLPIVAESSLDIQQPLVVGIDA